MSAAVAWGAFAASSLVIGALLGLLRAWPPRLVGLVLAFGAGALISAVSFDLAQEGAQLGDAGVVALGLAAGAITYFALNRLVRSRSGGGEDAGSALALGAFLDGIPEQTVLGIGIAAGDGVSVGLLVAIFVSNLPESIGSSTDMRAAGQRPATIRRLWLAVAVICTAATVVGYAIADNVSGNLNAAVDGFAAGALLVMLIDSMDLPRPSARAATSPGSSPFSASRSPPACRASPDRSVAEDRAGLLAEPLPHRRGAGDAGVDARRPRPSCARSRRSGTPAARRRPAGTARTAARAAGTRRRRRPPRARARRGARPPWSGTSPRRGRAPVRLLQRGTRPSRARCPRAPSPG